MRDCGEDCEACRNWVRRRRLLPGPYKGPDDPRPSWDEYFLGIAQAVAARADCTRAKHGAVIVKHNRIVATGYNGAPAGQPGCLTYGACPRGQKSYEELPTRAGDYSDCIAVHAEANALLYADRDRCEGATIYITGAPCAGCKKLILGAGIVRTVYQ